MSDIRVDTGLQNLPPGLQEELRRLVSRIGYHGCELANGETALYWHLVSVLNDHVKKK